MSGGVCRFCHSPVSVLSRFCSSCGGRLEREASETVLCRRLQLARCLVRSRSWNYVLKELRRIADELDEQPDLGAACSRDIAWLGHDMGDALAPHPDNPLPPLLDVARHVLQLDSGPILAGLRGKVERLQEVVDSLVGVEVTSGERGMPIARKLQTWFEQLARQVRLPLHVAREYVYASAQYWPIMARALNARAFQRAKVYVATANAQQHLRDKNFGLARQQFETILARRPKHVAAWEGLALTFVRLHLIAEAIPCYRQAVKHGTRRPLTFNNLAWYLCVGRTPTPAEVEEAVAAARRAVELAPLPVFWDTLAAALTCQGDTGAAVAAAREAVSGDPDKLRYRERLLGLTPRRVAPPPLLPDDIVEAIPVEEEWAPVLAVPLGPTPEPPAPILPAALAADIEMAETFDTLDTGLHTQLPPMAEVEMLEISPEDSMADFEDFSLGVDDGEP